MEKMKKWKKIALAVVVLLAVVVATCPLWTGPLAATAARCVVPRLTGTEFEVGSIRVNPFTCSLRVEKLRLANPEGFPEQDAVRFDKLSVKAELLSVFKDVITVNEVLLENPFASYLDANGTNNIEQILSNLPFGNGEESAGEEQAKEEEPGDEGKKIIINHLAIYGAKVRYGVLTLPVPPLVIDGLGADQGGITFSGVGVAIWDKIQTSFSNLGSLFGTGAGKTMDAIGTGAGKTMDAIGTGAGNTMDAIGTGAGKTMDAIGTGAGKTMDAIGSGAQKATEAIGNLFK